MSDDKNNQLISDILVFTAEDGQVNADASRYLKRDVFVLLTVARGSRIIVSRRRMGSHNAGAVGRSGLLAAVVALMLLLTGCVRDYVMPPAKVRAPGYAVESLYSEGLCVVSERQELRRGYMDLEGRIVIAPRFFAAGQFNGGLAPVRLKAWDDYGYIDRQGRTVIEPRFDAALAFAGDLAPVRIGGLWGFIDRQGRDVVPPRFDMAFAFSHGRARVVLAGFAGFIDDTGALVVAAKYFRAGDYREGLAMVCDGRLCGYLDRAGNPVIAMEYDDAGAFAEGLAPVRKGKLWGYIDRSGRMVIPPRFDQATPFAEGLARVSRHGQFLGFIDREGREALRTVLDGAEPFAEGRTVVRVPAHGFTTDATDIRIVDAGGTHLSGRFDVAGAFREGRAVVTMASGDKSYVIDRDGRPLIEVERSYPGDHDASARHNPGVRFGYIDTEGRTILDHAWLTAQPFSEGLAFVEGPHKKGRRTRGYVDATGRLALGVTNEISRALPFSGGLALVSKSPRGPSRYGYMDRAGRMRIDFRYANAAPFRDGLAAVKFSDELGVHDWGYVDSTGTVVIAPRFHLAGSFADGIAYVEEITDRNSIIPAVINRNGDVVVDNPLIVEWSHAFFGVPSLEQFRNRRNMVFDDKLIPRYSGRERGYVDAGNRLVIPGARFQTLGVFREGLAPVSVAGRWGYIDTAGRLVIEPRFAAAGPFHEGLAAVRDDAGRTGYVRPDGILAIEPLWLEEAHPFADGRACVKINGHYGYLDANGRFAVPAIYLRADDFNEGLAPAALPAHRR